MLRLDLVIKARLSKSTLYSVFFSLCQCIAPLYQWSRQWGNYAAEAEGGESVMSRVMASGRLPPSEGQLQRRARRREVLQERRARQMAERARLKAAVRGRESRDGGSKATSLCF